jgi:hypothetical protein
MFIINMSVGSKSRIESPSILEHRQNARKFSFLRHWVWQ